MSMDKDLQFDNVFSSGSGLDSLLDNEQFKFVPPSMLTPDPEQPRKRGLDPDSLMDIRATLKKSPTNPSPKIDQPIIVRPKNADGLYMIKTGERRWRSATLEGLSEVPILIDDSDETPAQRKLSQVRENEARQNMDPRDSGDAYLQLIERYDFTQSDVASAVGVSSRDVSERVSIAKAARDKKTSYITDLLDSEVSDQSSIAMLLRSHKTNPKLTKLAVSWMRKSERLSRRNASLLKKVDVTSELSIESQLDEFKSLVNGSGASVAEVQPPLPESKVSHAKKPNDVESSDSKQIADKSPEPAKKKEQPEPHASGSDESPLPDGVPLENPVIQVLYEDQVYKLVLNHAPREPTSVFLLPLFSSDTKDMISAPCDQLDVLSISDASSES